MTRKTESPMRFNLSKERNSDIVRKLTEMFKQDFDEDLSHFHAEQILQFFLKRLGPSIYNQAIQDACGFMMEQVQDLDATYYENEEHGQYTVERNHSEIEKLGIDFDSLPWETPMPGLRVKIFNDGGRRVRLAQMSVEFVEPSWCELGHIGLVLEGELEIDFHGTIVRYPKGHGFSIPQGVAHQHKARSIASISTIFLVDDL